MLRISNLLNRPVSIDFINVLKPNETKVLDIEYSSHIRELERIRAISVDIIPDSVLETSSTNNNEETSTENDSKSDKKAKKI